MSDSVIPTIHLDKFSDAGELERARVVAEVRKALEQVGFLMIAGHGIASSLIDRVTQTSLTFFDRPEAEKLKFASTKPGARGYTRMRGRTVGKSHDGSYLASLQESYGIGRIDVPDDPYFRTEAAGHSFADNIWPDRPSDFEPAMVEYYHAMERIYRTIMRLFAIALDLPENYFDKTIDKHGSLLRLTHYPSLDSEPLPGEYRSGAHTDGGALTILHIDDTPNSLQVKLRSGEWINVNRVPGTFVINIGDMMMRWTNDKWTSNWHQVVNPPIVHGRSDRRLSLVYFCGTNYDTIVECLPNCSGPDNPARYEPIVSGQFVAERFNRRYGIEPPAAQKA